MDNAKLLERLEPRAGLLHMVLDTDTYNEVDDQFALVYALLSEKRLKVEAVYAAPFLNDRSESPEDGMEKSHSEILRLLDKMGRPAEGFVFKGSKAFLESTLTPVASEAALDLVDRAMKRQEEEPLYVVAIGAITNIASAILLQPEIINKIVVVWLGGHPHYWDHTLEFNLKQDIYASRVIFDSGVPLVQIPCMGVASHLLTSVPELEAYLAGKNEICDALVELFKQYRTDHFGWAKELWDISAIAYMINPEWVKTAIVHSPVLTVSCTYSTDKRRHFMRVATQLDRNSIFRDMFKKLTGRV